MAKTEQELLQAVLEARRGVAEQEGFLADAKEVKNEAEAALIEYMDNRELKSFKSSVLFCTVVRKETLYVSIDKDKKDEALKFVEEDCGRGDIVKRSIHNKTLSSFISNRLRNGESVPQEMFKYYFKPELAITMAK